MAGAKQPPSALERVLYKAADDAAFRRELLDHRSEAARRIAPDLTPSEAAMLEATPPAQLELVIRKLRGVSSAKVVLGTTAAVAAVAAAVAVIVPSQVTMGCRIDRPPTAIEAVEQSPATPPIDLVNQPTSQPTTELTSPRINESTNPRSNE
ncbi:MAG: hypothetical protein BWX88_05176 [Planctomycetes bacterium ADurb.Bin126]|nr:MAG: hypothetical protein BWX88_05176 [Planctomycetes bacterium ADurb.Bin126]HOD84834.1 hypothetical protein [Phycisphaerae bacterium]HQL76381.1 hypothetical protein [Phycisphaerae bacterium]